MSSRKRGRAAVDSDDEQGRELQPARSSKGSSDEKQEAGKGKVGGDTITTFIRNTFNVSRAGDTLTAERPT